MQKIFPFDDVIADEIVASLCQRRHALMQSAKHGGSHGVPGKCPVPHLLEGEGMPIQKQVKRKADEWNVELLLCPQGESRFPCTGRSGDNNNFAGSKSGVHGLISPVINKIFLVLFSSSLLNVVILSEAKDL